MEFRAWSAPRGARRADGRGDRAHPAALVRGRDQPSRSAFRHGRRPYPPRTRAAPRAAHHRRRSPARSPAVAGRRSPHARDAPRRDDRRRLARRRCSGVSAADEVPSSTCPCSRRACGSCRPVSSPAASTRSTPFPGSATPTPRIPSSRSTRLATGARSTSRGSRPNGTSRTSAKWSIVATCSTTRASLPVPRGRGRGRVRRGHRRDLRQSDARGMAGSARCADDAVDGRADRLGSES